MNILYFTLDDFDSLIHYRSINTDLLREFEKHGHKVYVISPSERKKRVQTRVIKEKEAVVLKLRIGNIQKTNIVKKGLNTLLIGSKLIRAIKKEWADVRFDLILYCTPPITFLSVVEYVKKRDDARTYLLLKDIFPQNAVDIGMLRKNGLLGFLYKFFRRQEKRLYAISDRIGCMSPANVEYVLKHNPEVRRRQAISFEQERKPVVEVCANSIEVVEKSVDDKTRKQIRKKYSIPLDKTIFVYGGNLGKPQGIPFLIECLRKCEDIENVYFLIVGDGTEYHLLYRYIKNEQPKNIRLMNHLPKDDYDTMVGACDVGLIFLDYRFTIPNFPSRLLSYMQAKLPILACTDPNTDIGNIIMGIDRIGNATHEPFGWWCESNNADSFYRQVKRICKNETLKVYGEQGLNYLKDNYTVEKAYRTIL